MQFKNDEQISLKERLEKFNLPTKLVDKIILHADDNWVEQLIIKLKNASNPEEALSSTLELFLLKSFSNTPHYLNKNMTVKRFPISKRTFEDLVRARLLPFVEINQKNRVYDLDEIYKHLEEYKVHSIVHRVDPVSLHALIQQLG